MTHKKRVIFSVLLTSVLVSLSMISACAKDGDIEMDLLQCQLRIEPSNPYQYLGEDETYEVTCDNPDSLPKNPVYEWTFQSEDKTVLDTYIYRKSGDFIKTDVKDYEFKKEGTNTIRVDLYEEDEFDVAGNLAGLETGWLSRGSRQAARHAARLGPPERARQETSLDRRNHGVQRSQRRGIRFRRVCGRTLAHEGRLRPCLQTSERAEESRLRPRSF